MVEEGRLSEAIGSTNYAAAFSAAMSAAVGSELATLVSTFLRPPTAAATASAETSTLSDIVLVVEGEEGWWLVGLRTGREERRKK